MAEHAWMRTFAASKMPITNMTSPAPSWPWKFPRFTLLPVTDVPHERKPSNAHEPGVGKLVGTGDGSIVGTEVGS